MDRLMRTLPRPSQSTVRDLLAIACVAGIIAGVAIVAGIGWAAIVGGLLGLALIAAWSYAATVATGGGEQ